jgi:hypothetical protein
MTTGMHHVSVKADELHRRGAALRALSAPDWITLIDCARINRIGRAFPSILCSLLALYMRMVNVPPSR